MRSSLHYSGLVTAAIRRFINGERPIDDAKGMHADQDQANGAYGVKQLRVRLPGDPNVYRVLIAPAEAPITINGMLADQYFSEPITAGLDDVALGFIKEAV